MNKKRKSNPDKNSKRPSKKHKDKYPDKGQPNPDDPYEETGPPIKEMPSTSKPHR